ncbi:MAG: dehydratase [Chloroflexi bacterium]|jgi:acyl dehydratase|nr:dehydratase [Chloroflexota bacterium]
MTDRKTAAARVYFEDVTEGTELPPLVNPPVNHTMLVKYAGASGDFNPLHTDPAVGQKFGLGGPIAHGMLIMGFLGHFISDYLGGSGPLKRFGVRFKSMTRHEDVITCTGVITHKYEEDGQHLIKANVFATDQTGEVKASGSFTAVLPTRS